MHSQLIVKDKTKQNRTIKNKENENMKKNMKK